MISYVVIMDRKNVLDVQLKRQKSVNHRLHSVHRQFSKQENIKDLLTFSGLSMQVKK